MPLLSAAAAAVRLLTRNWRTAAVVVLVAAALAAGLWAKGRLDAAYLERNIALLALDSLEAVADTTRLTQVAAYGRLVDVYRRRAVQTRDVSDSLSRALDRETRARVRLEARLDDVTASVVGEGTTTDSVHAAEFAFYREPYDVWARVTMLDPPTMDFRIVADPVPLTLYVGCGTGERLSRAYADVRAPDWASVALSDVRYHPDVCNPGAFEPPSTWELLRPTAATAGKTLGGIGLLVGLHRLVTGRWLPF